MSELRFQGMIEALYNLSGDELRILAWEALLISDGPDKAPENAPTPDSRVQVHIVDITPDMQEPGFIIRADDGWETGFNTMPDTPITPSPDFT